MKDAGAAVNAFDGETLRSMLTDFRVATGCCGAEEFGGETHTKVQGISP
jgi:hypothetical protein